MKRSLRVMAALSMVAIAVLAVVGCQSATPQPAPTQPPAKPTAAQPATQPTGAPQPTAQPTAVQPAPTKAAAAAAPAWAPSRPIEMAVAFAAGGGTGITGETINKIATDNKFSPQPITVSYKPGANGQIGWSYLASKKGDPHVFGLMTMGIITGPLLTDTPLKLSDFTPIALVALDELLLVTNPNTPYKTVADLVDAAKKAPKSIKVAAVGNTGNDATVIAMLEKAAGIEFNLIPFPGGAEVNAAILGGQVDLATMNPNEVAPTLEAGKLRAIAFFGEKRMSGYKDLPTVKEAGYDVQLFNPRGVIGPSGITKDQQQWYIDLIKKVTGTDAWNDYVSKNMMTPMSLVGDDFGKYLTDTQERLRGIYKEMGILKEK